MTSLNDRGISVGIAAYSRKDVAGLLGIGERHVDRMTAAKLIPGAFYMGRLVRYRRAIIDQWLSGDAATDQGAGA